MRSTSSSVAVVLSCVGILPLLLGSSSSNSELAPPAAAQGGSLPAVTCTSYLGVLTQQGGTTGDCFGEAIAQDGNTLAVGAGGDNFSSGSVFVHSGSGGQWGQPIQLQASDLSPQDRFGCSLSLDGDRLAVGARMANGPVVDTGAVYIFERIAGVWTETAKITASDASLSAYFGATVALDGDRLAVGSTLAPPSGHGAVYIFELVGGVWTEIDKLTPADVAADDVFGSGLDLQGDRFAAGSSGDDDLGPNSGSAYVFDLVGGVWTETDKITASDGTQDDFFGQAIHLDGEQLAVGAYNADSIGLRTGEAYVFVNSGSGWVQQGALTPSSPDQNQMLGSSVLLSGDQLLVGAPGTTDNGVGSGAVFLFERAGGVWSESKKLLSPGSGLGQYQLGNALARDGAAVIAGEWHNGSQGSDSGAVRNFLLEASVEIYCTAKVNSQGCLSAISTSGVLSASAPNGFVVSASNIVPSVFGLFIYSKTGPDALPFQGGYLCIKPVIRRTNLQNSGGAAPCSGTFTFDLNAWIAGGNDPQLVPGIQVWGQYWSRDPLSPSTTNLTNAFRTQVCP